MARRPQQRAQSTDTTSKGSGLWGTLEWVQSLEAFTLQPKGPDACPKILSTMSRVLKDSFVARDLHNIKHVVLMAWLMGMYKNIIIYICIQKLIYVLLYSTRLNPFNCPLPCGSENWKPRFNFIGLYFQGTFSLSLKPSHNYLSCKKQLQSVPGWNVSSENPLTMSSDLNIYSHHPTFRGNTEFYELWRTVKRHIVVVRSVVLGSLFEAIRISERY